MYVTTMVLDFAAWLLVEVEESYSKDNQAYRDTVHQVLGMHRVYFGRLPDIVLYNLIKENLPPHAGR